MNTKTPLEPAAFMKLAASTVGDRGTENGYDDGQERSAQKVAEVFNALTGHQIKESDVWTLLIVLKLVRNQRKFKLDNIVDLIGYSGLLGECLDRDSEEMTDFHYMMISEAANLASETSTLKSDATADPLFTPVEDPLPDTTARCRECRRAVGSIHDYLCPIKNPIVTISDC